VETQQDRSHIGRLKVKYACI